MTPSALKKNRKKLGLSQFAVASSAKVSRYKISLYECGFGPLTKEELVRINNSLALLEKKGASHVRDSKNQP
jgi:transcriptional regulator with XRE-family HTH domain